MFIQITWVTNEKLRPISTEKRNIAAAHIITFGDWSVTTANQTYPCRETAEQLAKMIEKTRFTGCKTIITLEDICK